MEIELATDPDACMMYIVSPVAQLQAWAGAYCGGLPLTACFKSILSFHRSIQSGSISDSLLTAEIFC